MTERETRGEYRPSDRHTSGLALTFFLLGTAVGAATALLLAPQSGRQTRRLLRRKYGEAADAVAEGAERLEERGTELMEEAREKVTQAKQRVAPFVRRKS